jgi:hypothetical protein
MSLLMTPISSIPRLGNIREALRVRFVTDENRPVEERVMEHDVVLTRKDGTTRHFSIYGRSAPNLGEVVTLPVDGQLVKARVGEIHGVGSVDHIDAAEFEEV